MKTATWLIMLLPGTLLGLSIICEDEFGVTEVLGWLSLPAAVFCLSWAFYIRREHRALGWFCGAVGLLYVIALLLPAFATAKTRGKASATQTAPNHSMQRTEASRSARAVLVAQ